jgi:hypothetical protein
MPNHNGGGGARDADHVVVLGKPEPTVAPPLGVLREVEGVAQRGRWRRALGDGGEVEDGERSEGG